MKPKDINRIILTQSEPFFNKEGFKLSKADMGYLKLQNGTRIRYGFSYVERKPQYYYEIYIYIRLIEVEEIYSKIDGTNNLGETYVFPISYFLDSTDYIDKNPKFVIQKIEDVHDFSYKLIENYNKYAEEFIPFITQPQNMLDFLLSEIETGQQYAVDDSVFIRTLILMNILGYAAIEDKLKEFKAKLVNYREDIKELSYIQMENAVRSNY